MGFAKLNFLQPSFVAKTKRLVRAFPYLEISERYH